jgi:hypothetical protein
MNPEASSGLFQIKIEIKKARSNLTKNGLTFICIVADSGVINSEKFKSIKKLFSRRIKHSLKDVLYFVGI